MSEANGSVQGGCHCGQVRFELTFPTQMCSHCHCESCRKSHGAAFVTWTSVPTKQFKFFSGEDKIKKFAARPEVRWGFCSDCGTPLLYDCDAAPDQVYISVGSLNGPLDREPDSHVSFEEHVDWLDVNDGLPRYKGKSDERIDESTSKTSHHKSDFSVKPVASEDKTWVASLKDVAFNGADFIVTRGRKAHPMELPGFYAETADGKRIGYLGYEVIGDVCEIVTLDAFGKFHGVGTALAQALITEARLRKWKKIWLITTNDNLDALRFYQKRGFVMTRVHAGAVEVSRKMKPTIPAVGNFGIAVRDEIELEMRL